MAAETGLSWGHDRPDPITPGKEETIHDTREALAPERAILVGIAGLDSQGEESLDELALLTRTAGAVVLGRVFQKRHALDASSYIGKGKLQELKAAVGESDADLVIVDDELTPAQTRNIEREIKVKVIDRSTLILDIFARHARTAESKLQVELAQLQYLLPRLARMWEHLGRPGGGIGTRGPGETQIEVDRRRIRTRISKLKEKIAQVAVERSVQRDRRTGTFRIALVGYTNAGKSTLFNGLTRAGVPVADRLFETLDTTTRRLHVGNGVTVLISDTVGFIRKLPHHLVASFRSTLNEVTEADLLLHVADASSSNLGAQIEAVEAVLDELETSGARQLILNKIDCVHDEDELIALRSRHPGAWFVCAQHRPDVEESHRRIVDAWHEWRVDGRNENRLAHADRAVAIEAADTAERRSSP